MKEKVYQPITNYMVVQQRMIKSVFEKIPEVMVIKSIENMNKTRLMVAVEGWPF